MQIEDIVKIGSVNGLTLRIVPMADGSTIHAFYSFDTCLLQLHITAYASRDEDGEDEPDACITAQHFDIRWFSIATAKHQAILHALYPTLYPQVSNLNQVKAVDGKDFNKWEAH